MREQVENIVSSVVGPGRARVQLTADFDFNRVTQTSDRFDPEGRVVRSSQTREETQASHEAREGQVTVGNELPGAQQNRQGADNNAESGHKSDNRKSEEIVNYEISRTTKTEVIEGGRVNRISVAVLVDGIYAKNDKGEIGLCAARQGRTRPDRGAGALGDRLRPEARRPGRSRQSALRRSAAEHPVREPKGWFDLPAIHQGRHHARHRARRDGLLGLIVLFFVVRPLVRRIVDAGRPARGTLLADGTSPARTASC